MNIVRRSDISLIAVLSVVCCLTPSALAGNKIPRARLAKGVYTSPGGEYSVKVPPLLEPGAWSEERQVDDITHGAFFGDDLGHVFYVLLIDNASIKATLDQIARNFPVGEFLRENTLVTTSRGSELRLVRINKGGSPLVARTKKDGERLERKLDLIEAWSMFLQGERVFQVTAGTTLLSGTGRSEAELVSESKKALDGFLEGVQIGPPPSAP